MKVFNKFVESKTEPSNKNDIWFDGSVFKIYREGNWQKLTIPIEDIESVLDRLEGVNIFKFVDELPNEGKTNTIYLVPNDKGVESNNLIEYVYTDNGWEIIGSYTPFFELDGYITEDELANTLKEYITDNELTSKGYATETYVNDAISNIKVEGGGPSGGITPEQLQSIQQQIEKKQDLLINGVNIKTINDHPILGNGNIVVGRETYVPNASDNATVDIQNVTAEDLKGKSFNEVLDTVFFPEYDANAGVLPVITIVNNNEILEVGNTINNATFNVTEGSKYKYIKDSNGKYTEGIYGYEDPTVTTTKTSETAIFGIVTRNTAQTTYKVIGPSADKLSDNAFLYKSKGTPSTVKPKLVGEESKTLNSTSVSITGVYAGGKNGSKSTEIWVNPSGQVSSSINKNYANTLSYNILNDNGSTSDHVFSTIGTPSVELYVPNNVNYIIKLTATKYDAGSGQFIEDTALTTKLNNLTPSIGTKTFKDRGDKEYTVKSYSVDTKDITTSGKFKVAMSITKA